VVTGGAAAGIGRATAELFACEGACLVLADINTDGLSALHDSLVDVTDDVAVVTAEVSKPEDSRRMINVATEQYGRLDIAIANAGIIPLASVVEATADDWEEVMAIDGRGMFLTCKYAIEQMLTTGGGSIVCLSSISGVAGQARQSTYGPAKFVASGLTKHLAVEWASHGIRVNAVAPGTINTERGAAAAGGAGWAGVSGDDQSRTPDGKVGRAERGGGGDLVPCLRSSVLYHRRNTSR
jgi:NAD(P)-dependent dehydrogenase (short-subunit alcohol dehydrogenase family)